MNFVGDRFTIVEQINLLQRWIIFHSYLYYHMDVSIVSDHMYDNNSKQLAELKNLYPVEWTCGRYTYAMEDFDGSTGLGIIYSLNQEDLDKILIDVRINLSWRG